MKIREMTETDRQEVFDMMRVFYDSPAVIYTSPDAVLMQDITDCVGECPFVEGYVFEVEEKIAGYAMLAKSYSTEYGGMCIWVEDLYIKPDYRGQGIGSAFFRELEKWYDDKAVRFRLEVEEENVPALATYKKAGYAKLSYVEMTREVEE